MNTTLLPEFAELYEVFRQSEDYASRVRQFSIVEVNREIIEETLQNEPLKNEHLTGLIQMFKYGCSDNSFDKYLNLNITNLARRKEISDKADKIDQWGYTGAGLNAITNLTSKELATIKKFLQNAITIKTIDEAIELCEIFDQEGISFVKSGIYSPWLYYINPEIFPITNNSHLKFRTWIGMPQDYPTCIKDFNELKVLVNEKELGVIDMFGHLFEKYSKKHSNMNTLNLQGKKLYKISHGIFKKHSKYKHTGYLEILEKNNWISIGLYTRKSQAKNFIDKTEIGDFVYICYGGDELYCIGKITSNSKPLDIETKESLKIDDEWIYREIEPLYFPSITSVKELKNDRRSFMPSGNSTFYQVPSKELEFMNSSIFTPKFQIKIIDSMTTMPEDNNSNEEKYNNIYSLNTILYGPPGTGKTYGTIDIALEILGETPKKKRSEDKELFSNFQQQGRVFFTTFHQNMAYEDFIEGIKPLEPDEDDEYLKYDIEDGLFMRACVEATYNFIVSNFTEDKTVEEQQGFNALFSHLIERVSNEGQTVLSTKSGGEVTVTVTKNGNFSAKHSGSEKPYTVSRERLSRIYKNYTKPNDIQNIHEAFRGVIGGCNSTVFWSVLNAIAEIRDSNGGAKAQEIDNPIALNYEDKRQIVQNYWAKKEYMVLKRENDKSDPYVFIIDEINRGNVAQIFGELISLIEDDKRLGRDEVLFAELPYSKQTFAVPPNLYIVGTMNTADRSVEALDTALRRRFSFILKNPEESKLKEKIIDGCNITLLLSNINTRLRVLKDNDHTIGHAWLWDVNDFDGLKRVFEDKIIPLLQEYFYNDYEKLGLVLGDKIVIIENTVNKQTFATFPDSVVLANQYRNKGVYKIKSAAEWQPSDFISIYETTASENNA